MPFVIQLVEIYHLPNGPVITWYPGQAPNLPKNEGIHEQAIDLGNTQVLPMPKDEADIKAQGFPQAQSDWRDAILIFPTNTGVKAIYIAYKTLEVGVVTEYGKAKAMAGDGTVHRDHQPSKAALLDRAVELKGYKLKPSEKKRIINGALSVNVPADVHRAGPTYGGKNTLELRNADKDDLAGAAARDANAMVENAQTLTPEYVNVLRDAGATIKQKTNAEYDEWLLQQLDNRSND